MSRAAFAPLSQPALVERLREVAAAASGAEAAAAIEVETFRGQASVRLPAAVAAAILAATRDDAELDFQMLTDVTCVHLPRRPPPLGEFDVVYHLTSVRRNHRLRLKVACPDAEAGVSSLTATWPGANYMEREAYDMFGVRFTGHPDLRRILMPEGFDGWPLRKEYPYRGR